MARPKIYSDEDYELFEKQVLDYIKLCEENEEPITIGRKILQSNEFLKIIPDDCESQVG